MKTVVFDLGVVVLGWNPGEAFLRRWPHRVRSEAHGQLFAVELFTSGPWKAFDQGLTDEPGVNAALKAQLGYQDHEVEDLHQFVRQELAPAADTVDLIEQLAARRDAGEALRLLYLSNMPASYARYIEATHGFMQHFDGGIFSADVQHIKPEPPVYHLMAERFGLQAHNTFFIDDHAPNLDVPRAMGWAVHHFTDRAAALAAVRHWVG